MYCFITIDYSNGVVRWQTDDGRSGSDPLPDGEPTPLVLGKVIMAKLLGKGPFAFEVRVDVSGVKS